MNEMKVLTVRDVSFKDDNGKQVSGQQLWVTAPIADPAWRDGFEILKIWIDDGSTLEPAVSDLKAGDLIMVEFNRRGKPQTIVPVR